MFFSSKRECAPHSPDEGIFIGNDLIDLICEHLKNKLSKQ
jgi:hypothetical protein